MDIIVIGGDMVAAVTPLSDMLVSVVNGDMVASAWALDRSLDRWAADTMNTPTDAILIATTKVVVDTVAPADIATLATTKPLADAVDASTDVYSSLISWVRAFSETVTMSDVVTSFATTLPKADAATMSDSANINGAPNLGDSTTNVDVAALATTKPFADTLSAPTDTGSIIDQGYMDSNTYFQDDYIGVKVTF